MHPALVAGQLGSSTQLLPRRPFPAAAQPCARLPALPPRVLPFGAAANSSSSCSSSGFVNAWSSSSSSGRGLRQSVRAADAGTLGDMGGESSADPPYEYKPFKRLRERDPHRLLGVAKEASFEEIQDARNYLFEQYKWHEPSREAIEGAFDKLLQKHMGKRFRFGFSPPRYGKRGEAIGVGRQPSLLDRVLDLFDPTVTTRTIVNEGAVFGAFALWVLFSTDQGFPLAAAFAYSVYQFQSKRVKRNPEGPFFGGNAIVGAIFSTLCCLAVACGVMALLTTPLTAVLGQSTRQVGGFITIAVMGAVGIYLK